MEVLYAALRWPSENLTWNWSHKRNTISHPDGVLMGCQLCRFGRTLSPLQSVALLFPGDRGLMIIALRWHHCDDSQNLIWNGSRLRHIISYPKGKLWGVYCQDKGSHWHIFNALRWFIHSDRGLMVIRNNVVILPGICITMWYIKFSIPMLVWH